MTHSVASILGPLYDVRGAKTLERRIKKLTNRLSGTRAFRRITTRLFKGNIHDHIDCSLEYDTMLDLWDKLYDFNFANFQFPAGTLAYWKAVSFDPSAVAFSSEIINAWRCTDVDTALTGPARTAAVRASKKAAVKLYRQFLITYGGGSLFQYVQAIVVHILPLMQTPENIQRIIKERLARGVKNGERFAELRGAPQLHTMLGLTNEQAVQAYVASVADAPYPVNLTICALRHEDGKLAWELAKLAGKYRNQGVRRFDLAADEASNPGVLPWWVKPAILAKLFGLDLTIHLWETNEPTDNDIRFLNAFDTMVPEVESRLDELEVNIEDVIVDAKIEIVVEHIIEQVIAETLSPDKPVSMTVFGEHVIGNLGHGFRGHRQGSRVCEVCFSSNVVTHQVESFAAHPAHALFHVDDALMTIATDGTTLIGITGLVDEYLLLQENGWGIDDLLVTNLIGIRASSFTQTEKLQLIRECLDSYEAIADEFGV